MPDELDKLGLTLGDILMKLCSLTLTSIIAFQNSGDLGDYLSKAK